jgi:hypothetical protein
MSEKGSANLWRKEDRLPDRLRRPFLLRLAATAR